MLYVILYRLLNVTSQLLIQCIILGMRLTNCSNSNCRKQFQLSYLWAFVKAVVFFLWYIVTSFCYLCFRLANYYESLWFLLESYFVKCFL